jgi:predicted small lipoprotein YifL
MRKPLMIAACTVLLASLAACHQQGPAEHAGSSLDRAGQKVQDTLNPPQGPAQRAGRSIDRTLGND